MLRRLTEELRQAGGWRLAVVAAAGLAVAVFLYRSDWPLYRGLRERGVPVDGWVTLKGLNAPDELSYSFEAEGRTYSDVGKAGYGNRAFADLEAGDRVLVFYVPEHPETHCLGDPSEHLRDQNRAMFLPLAVFSLALGAFLANELKKQGP